MKLKKNKNAFTLVELLAVIVILAIILVIAVPQIMNVIKDTTKASLESSTKMVEAQVENQYTVAQTLGKEFGNIGSCMEDWAGLNHVDYESCTYEITSDGTATVTIGGKGKFKGLNVCNATRSSATATEEECVLTCKDNEVLVEDVCVKATNEACFNFDSSTGTLVKYYLYENNDELQPTCPLDVKIPRKINGVEVMKIGGEAFTTCEDDFCDGYSNPLGITSVIIPTTVIEIGSHAFFNNPITIVNWKDLINLKIIGNSSFSNNQLSGELDLSKLTNLTEIGFYSFYLTKITSVKLPTSITTIERGAFRAYPEITTIINPSGNSFDWELATSAGTDGLCVFATGTCGSITIKAS